MASDLRIGSTKPVYVLFDKATFSAAEDFVYALQALKRVTVIGETTKGGAHNGRGFKLDDHFFASIPHRVSNNPVTHTDWEGTGITPDVAVAAADALPTAQALAAKAIASAPKR